MVTIIIKGTPNNILNDFGVNVHATNHIEHRKAVKEIGEVISKRNGIEFLLESWQTEINDIAGSKFVYTFTFVSNN
jgi:hypothetical protein